MSSNRLTYREATGPLPQMAPQMADILVLFTGNGCRSGCSDGPEMLGSAPCRRDRGAPCMTRGMPSAYARRVGWIIAAVVIGVLVGFFVVGYNGLVKRRNRVDTAWGQIEVQLQRRYDLIPNLVETVKGYATHEKSTFEDVTKARSASAAASTPGEQAAADNFLTAALRQLFAVAEDYPELRASANFATLQADLSEAENKIAVSRQIYNDTVLTYNNTVQQIPTNLIASVAGFEPRELYDAPDAADTAPAVDF